MVASTNRHDDGLTMVVLQHAPTDAVSDKRTKALPSVRLGTNCQQHIAMAGAKLEN